MSEHELKVWPEFYHALESGEKTFEIRLDDRGFHAGDTLYLREWDRQEGYSGRSMRRKVTYLLTGQPWLEREYVCMALASLSEAEPVAEYKQWVDGEGKQCGAILGITSKQIPSGSKLYLSPPPAPEAVRLLREAREALRKLTGISAYRSTEVIRGAATADQIATYLATLPT